MVDVHDKKQRSYNMSRIKGKNTKPELIVRKYLHANGFRFRLHDQALPGRPDIVLKKYQTIIFVHGCFWHRHPDCRYSTTPKSNQEFWNEKFTKTIENDLKHQSELKKEGWNIVVIWECELKRGLIEKNLYQLVNSIMGHKVHPAY